MPGFDPTKIGLQEATRLWIRDTIKTNLPALNQSLSRADSPIVIDTITSAMVFQGDPLQMPTYHEAPLMICVSGGGRIGGLDASYDQLYMGGMQPGYFCDIMTNIVVYVHPRAIYDDDPYTQVANREALLDRVQDWLIDGIFNNGVNLAPTLTSQVYSQGADHDVIDKCHIMSIERGFVDKSFAADEQIFALHARHYAEISGYF